MTPAYVASDQPRLTAIRLVSTARLRIINDRLKQAIYTFFHLANQETIVGHAQYQESISKTLGEISSALLALRDTLVELSLSLQDLRFEIDQEEQDKALAEVRALCEDIRAGRRASRSCGPVLVPDAGGVSCDTSSPQLSAPQELPAMLEGPCRQKTVPAAFGTSHPAPAVPDS